MSNPTANVSKEGDTEQKLPSNTLLKHVITFHGCFQILELVCCIVGIVCCFINTKWLKEAGGGFVVFSLLASLIFLLIFLILNLALEQKLLPKYQISECLGYIIGLVLLLVSAIVTVRACTLVFIEPEVHGRLMLLENSHIKGTAVFVILGVLLFLIHTILLSIRRWKEYQSVFSRKSTTAV